MTAPAKSVVIASTPAGDLTFTPNADGKPAAPRARTRDGQKAERPETPAAVAAMRAARLLGSLARVAEFRRQYGFTGRAAWDGVLRLAADLIAARAFYGDWPVGEVDLENWCRKHLTEAGPGAISAAWAEADGHAVIPSPAEAGEAIDLRVHEWIALGRPWGLHPVDASAERIEQVRLEVKRKAAATRRAKKGARPRASSDAAFCREHGLCARSYRRWKAKGEAELNGWLASKGVTVLVSSLLIYGEGGNTSDELRTCRATDKPVDRRPAPRLSGGAPKAIATISMMRIPATYRLGMFAMPAPRLPQNSGGSRHAT